MSTKPGDPGTDQFPDSVIMGIPPGLLKHAPPTRKKSPGILPLWVRICAISAILSDPAEVPAWRRPIPDADGYF